INNNYQILRKADSSKNNSLDLVFIRVCECTYVYVCVCAYRKLIYTCTKMVKSSSVLVILSFLLSFCGSNISFLIYVFFDNI
uniref:Uncharacterized protein n=1 Tax=Amphimedon queenslandica TaxID=400682 RepID=A0A1X7SNR2_AMPQE